MITSLTMAQFFEDGHNMLSTGMSLSQILLSIKESSNEQELKNAITQVEQHISQGDALCDAMAKVNIFPWIVPMTLRACEQSGRMEEGFDLLKQYFKQRHELKGKMIQALAYPLIVLVVLLMVMMFVGLKVVPQLKGLLPTEALNHGTTAVVVAASALLQHGWFVLPILIFGFAGALALLKQMNDDRYEELMYQWPVLGLIRKETDMASYFQLISILLKSGVPLLKAMNDLSIMHKSLVSKRIFQCREYMFGGMSFWESLAADKFFSSVVVFTIRRGEEMSKLDVYCSQLGAYFQKKVSNRIQTMVQLIQPAMLAVAGLLLAMIAFAFLIPIYSSLSQIAGG